MTVVVLVLRDTWNQWKPFGKKRTFPLMPAYSQSPHFRGQSPHFICLAFLQPLFFFFLHQSPLSFGPPATHHQFFLPIPLCLAARFAENVANFRKLASGQSPPGSPVLHYITISPGITINTNLLKQLYWWMRLICIFGEQKNQKSPTFSNDFRANQKSLKYKINLKSYIQEKKTEQKPMKD